MMKLIILLAAFIAISNGASCDNGAIVNTKLSDTCGTITVSGVGNGGLYNGQYKRIGDSLFQQYDPEDRSGTKMIERYLSYWWGKGGVYIGTVEGDRRCEGSTGSYGFRFDASILDDLIVGDEEEFTPTYPSSSSVTVSCDSASTVRATPAPVTPAPVTAPVEGVGSICLSTSYNGRLTAPIEIVFSRLAGQYIEIPGGLNGKPAYELVNSGDGCSASVTLMYVGQIGNTIYDRYYFARNRNDPTNNYYFACETDPISVGTCLGNLQDIMTITQGSDCVCGRTTPSPTTPTPEISGPVEGLGSICFSTSYRGSLTEPINIKFSTMAGQYVEIPGGINGKPAYELVNESSGECSQPSTLMYIGQIGNIIYDRYYFVSNKNDPTNSIIFDCGNSEAIGNNDLSAGTCEGGLQSIITLSQGSNCVCGRS